MLVATQTHAAHYVKVVLAARTAAARYASAAKDLELVIKSGVTDVQELRRAAEEKMLADVENIVAGWKLTSMLETMSAQERQILSETTGVLV